MSFISIQASDTGLQFSLEQYYEQLLQIIGEREEQPLLLNNTITTFDIVENAPFYTEGVFRNFADRKYKISPRDIGSSVETDRFSFEYERVLEIASTQIDGSINQDTREKIESYKREIRRVNKEVVTFEKDILNGWDEIVKAEGLDPEQPRYELRRLNYLESILYADQKKQFVEEMEEYQRMINNLRESAYSPSQQKLLRAVDELSESYKVARPHNIYFERDFPDANIITFADPTVRSKLFCDTSPAIYPSNNLVLFKERNPESHTLSVTENTTHNEKHERTWKAGGSGRFSAFGLRIGGSGGGSGSSSYRKDFKSLKRFDMGFEGIEEVYVNRGLWYDKSLFSDPVLKPLFDKIPGARDLEYVAVSLIIAKGVKITLSFDETLEKESWTRRKFNAGGGVSIFGYRFGGRGASTSYDYDYFLSEDKKQVTFTDDPEHCRILAVRLEKIYHLVDDDIG